MSVFSHDFQPGDIILMAVIMLHRKFQCHPTENQNGRTVNAVMFQKLMIIQPGFNRNILACKGSVRIHEITSCGADYITGHFKSGQLYRQLSFFPPVICIQKCHISAFRNRHTTVTGAGSTEISLIFYINKIRSVFPWNENFPGSINRAVINDNQFQWNILRINRLHCLGDVFLTIIYGHDHRYRWSYFFP